MGGALDVPVQCGGCTLVPSAVMGASDTKAPSSNRAEPTEYFLVFCRFRRFPRAEAPPWAPFVCSPLQNRILVADLSSTPEFLAGHTR